MAVLRTPAIILRHTTEREHDRLISVLTPQFGMQRLRARGTKKSVSKLAGSLEPLCEVDLSFAEGRTFGQITGSVITNRNTPVRQELIGLTMAQWFCELVEAVTKPDQLESGAYELLQSALKDFSEHHELSLGRRWMLLDRWAWRLLSGEGFVPAVTRCAVCGQELLDASIGYTPHVGFRHVEHTPLPESRVSREALAWLEQDVPAINGARELFHQVHDLVSHLLMSVLDRPLRSEGVLRSIMRQAQLSESKK